MAVNNKPVVGGSDGTWGTQLNEILDGLNPTIATGDLIYASATASSNGLLGRLPVGSANSVLTVGAASALQWSSSINLSGTASIAGAASVLSIYSTSGSINGTLNATTLQQGGNAVPTITTTARMAQGSVTVTTTAGGVASVSTGLTTITNFIPINGNSTSSLVFNASSTYSGGTASVIAKWFTSASTGASANGSVASAQSITINWLAFGT